MAAVVSRTDDLTSEIDIRPALPVVPASSVPSVSAAQMGEVASEGLVYADARAYVEQSRYNKIARDPAWFETFAARRPLVVGRFTALCGRRA